MVWKLNMKNWRKLLLTITLLMKDKLKSWNLKSKSCILRRDNGQESKRKVSWIFLKRLNLSMSRLNLRRRSRIWNLISLNTRVEMKHLELNLEAWEKKWRILRLNLRLPGKNLRLLIRWDLPLSSLDTNQELVNQNIKKDQDQSLEVQEEDTTNQLKRKVTSVLKVFWVNKKLKKWEVLHLDTVMKSKRDQFTNPRCLWESLWRSNTVMKKKETFTWPLSWSRLLKLLKSKLKMEFTTATIQTTSIFTTLMLSIWIDWLLNSVLTLSTKTAEMMDFIFLLKFLVDLFLQRNLLFSVWVLSLTSWFMQVCSLDQWKKFRILRVILMLFSWIQGQRREVEPYFEEYLVWNDEQRAK